MEGARQRKYQRHTQVHATMLSDVGLHGFRAERMKAAPLGNWELYVQVNLNKPGMWG